MPNLSCYSIAGNDRLTYIVVVNKDPTVTAAATINLGALGSRAAVLVLAGPGLDAPTGITLGGSSAALNGACSPERSCSPELVGATLSVDVPPSSAVLLKVP
jgi:hypothetical protein